MATINVTIKNMAYEPNPVQVNQGDSVIWTNADVMDHTATSDAGPGGNPPQGAIFNTGMLARNAKSAPITFNQAPGTSIGYLCTVHTFMTGTVQVNAASETAKQQGAGRSSAGD